MQTIYPKVRGFASYTTPDAAERLQHVRRLAKLMDSEFSIPGTKFRFGLDPLIGLLPGVGNLATSAFSILLVTTMMRHGASGELVVRMALNVLADSLVGAIPIVGNLFDFGFRANDRNVELLRSHYEDGKYTGSGRTLAWALIAAVVVVLGITAWAAFAMIAWLLHIIMG